jgi:regulatory protein
MSSPRLPTPARSKSPVRQSDVRVAAIKLLSRRDFASTELRNRLIALGFDEEGVLATMAALVADGTLNDERYARNYVTYHSGRGHGPQRIAAELRRLGVAPELIEIALGAGPDWHALARKVCRGKFGSEPPRNWPEKARQARFLQYRGFSADHIRAATGSDSDLD